MRKDADITHNTPDTQDTHNTQVIDMANSLRAHRDRNSYSKKLYKAESDQHKGQLLGADIRNRLTDLKKSEHRSKVDLFDIQDVRERTFQYFEACALAETYPSVMGLAVHGFNISRQHLNQWMNSHPNEESTEFIRQTKDSMADLLVNASLYRNADAVMSIFMLKNHFGHSDRVEVAPVEVNSGSETFNAADIARRYQIPE